MADGAVTSTLAAYGLLNQEANHNIYPAGLLAIIGEETSPSAASFSSRRQEDGIPDARLLDSIDLEWLCQQQSNLALHLMETKTKKHPNPVQGVVQHSQDRGGQVRTHLLFYQQHHQRHRAPHESCQSCTSVYALALSDSH